MSVFTVFFCGTASNSYDFDAHNNADYQGGELISLLAYHHTGREHVDYVVVDGPGSGNMQVKKLWTRATEYSETYGQATGAGWEENVQHALQVVLGSLTFEGAKTIELNGGARRELAGAGAPVERKTVKGWLTNATTHTLNRGITPQLLQQKKAEIRRRARGPIKFHYHTAKIVRNLAEQFLTRRGTTLRSRLNLTEHDVLRLYDGILENSAHYRALQKDIVLLKSISWDGYRYVLCGKADTKLDDDVNLALDPPFVNWHHRSLFRRCYPDIANCLEARRDVC